MSIPDSEYSNTPQRSDFQRAAIGFARRGIPVFPCTPGGKAPLTPRGHLDASTAPDQIREWWTRWPDANIGAPTGKRSGILALDVDQPAGLVELEAEHGKLPATRTHSTGSGGMHHLYQYPAGAEIRNSASKLAPGIDVRGEGGYIIVPPSRTMRPYEVLDDLPLADTPAWLIEAGRRPRSTASDATGNRPRSITSSAAVSADLDGPTIPAGTRDDGLARIAGRLHDGSRDLEGLTAELLEINARRCQPPLPDGQIEKIARSIHARTPCGKSATASAKTVEALEEIEAVLWGVEWRGMGELSARDVYVALIKAGRLYGEMIPSGVRVSISVRALALASAVSKPTAIKAMRRLMAAEMIRRDYGGRTGTEAGALVLLLPRAKVTHSSTGGGREGSGKHLRAPRLRWSAPDIRRLGKSCGAVLDALDRRGGTATLEDLADDLHKARPRDLRRRVIARLGAAGVVDCDGDTVTLARNWLEALDLEREASGEIAAYRRDMARFDRERIAYANRHRIRHDPVPERPPPRDISGLVECRPDDTAANPEPVEGANPELVEALSYYLYQHPGEHPDRHRPEDRKMQISCLASDLFWKHGRVDSQPTPAAVEAALPPVETAA
jgi:hypothetical protein